MGRILRGFLAEFFLVSSLVMAVDAAQAQVTIYSNLGPPLDPQTTGGYGVPGVGFVPPRISFDFTAGATAPLEQIATVFHSNGQAVFFDLTLQLRENDSGLPGAILESFSSKSVLLQASGSVAVNHHSVLQPTLQAGTTYWLTANAGSAAPYTVLWLANGIGATGTVYRPETVIVQPITSEGYRYSGVPQAAFRLLGPEVAASYSLSPTSLNFGLVRQGTTSTKQSVSLTNTGAPGLTISGLELLGVNKADFAISDNSCVGLIAQAGCSFNVSFTPSMTSLEAAHVTVNSNAASTTINNVGFQGTGATSGDVSRFGTSPPPTKQIDILAKLAESATPDYPAAPLPFSSNRKALNSVVALAANEEWQNGVGDEFDPCYVSTIDALNVKANRTALEAGLVETARYVYAASSITGLTGLVVSPAGEAILNVAVGTTLSLLEDRKPSTTTATTISEASVELAKYMLGRIVNEYTATLGKKVIDGFTSFLPTEIQKAFETYEHVFAWKLEGSNCTAVKDGCSQRARETRNQADFKAQLIYDPYSHYITASIVSTCKAIDTGAIQGYMAYFVVQKIKVNSLTPNEFVLDGPMKHLRSVNLDSP